MDPVVRALSNVRKLRESMANPFDRESLKEYFCKMGEDFGFSPVKNYKKRAARAECAWLDGNSVFAAINVEFGNDREKLGAIAELKMLEPDVAVLITASNPLKPIDELTKAAERLHPGKDTVIIDLK
jgi:hypothetical protein